MLTWRTINRFSNEVSKWRRLSAEEQDNVVSRSLELFYTKGMAGKVREPLRWLLQTAEFVKLEESRRRRHERDKFTAMCEMKASDRWRNGKPLNGRPSHSSINRGCSGGATDSAVARAWEVALHTLTRPQRQVAELCWLRAFTPAEAGGELRLRRSTAKSHLRRARAKLLDNAVLREIVRR